ncbi:MAG: hypothetical protein AB3N18_06305 [Allomuricauda sp.]
MKEEENKTHIDKDYFEVNYSDLEYVTPDGKYYRPSIQEFHIGYQFEQYNGYDWVKRNFENLNGIYNLENAINQNVIRVKLLDREDIESFGFEHVGSLWFKSKNSDHAIRKWKGFEVDIYGDYSYRDIPGHDKQCIFRGQIKNKSELKKILQMIGVIV